MNRSSDEAQRWHRGFMKAIATLSKSPRRCPLAHEDAKFPFKLRELLYGIGSKKTHRDLLTIRESAAFVLAIRHTAQPDVTSEDI